MRKTIERVITLTEVKSGVIKFENGLPVVTEVRVDIFNGSMTDEKATRLVQTAYGANTVVIEKKEINDRYEISVEDFMKYATKVVPASTTTEATTQEGEAKTE